MAITKMSAPRVLILCTVWLLCTAKATTRLADTLNITELTEEAVELIKNNSTYTLPVNNNRYFDNLASNDTLSFGTFDFIIVGGGTAGGVLANRLTEESYEVLVIEAGGEDPNISSVVGLLHYFQNSQWNWGFNTTPQENACFSNSKKQCDFPRGKVLGGSSEINGAFYVRGNKKNYDYWEEQGNVGWSYDDVLPYFKLSEYGNFSGDVDTSYHGFDGPQSIEFSPEIANLTSALGEGLQEIGLEEVDYNGENQLGFGKTQNFLAYNRRASVNYSFIQSIRNRSNLVITLDSLVTKVLIEDNVAVGVQFIKDGQYYIANATNEVILSAGVISTPQILMLSGIGPSEELEKHGIEVIADLPVGKHLQDHAVMFGAVTYPTYEVYYNVSLQEAMELWGQNEGPLVSRASYFAFFDVNNDTDPDVELIVAASYTNDDYGNFIVNKVSIGVQNNLPTSVGEVTLASNDPRDFPLVNPNYFGNETDLEVMYQAAQFALELSNTTGFQKISSGYQVSGPDECNDGYDTLTREWWYCVFQYRAQSDYHPVGTTRMGTSPNNSVVDSNLKVHGIDRLRVVDAGVIPQILSGHTNAATIMIAEKISDVIKQDYS